jgi:hypothetical protein
LKKINNLIRYKLKVKKPNFTSRVNMSRCFGASQVSSPSSSSISASLTISFSMYPEMIIFLKITLFDTKYN